MSQMAPETRRVLDYVIANPRCSGGQVAAAFPDDPRAYRRLGNLRDCHHVRTERIPGSREYAYIALVTERVERAQRPKPEPGPRTRHVGQITPPRVVPIDTPWPEPYLTDVGVRSSGLDYRDCPSRRGDQLVYCYRRGFGRATL